MSKDSESERDDGQKTVAELLAQYGADGPPTARRRRRRDDDEINQTAPQTIINRILTDSGQMRAIRDEGQDGGQPPHQGQPQQPPRPQAAPGQGTGRFAAPPPPPAPQRFEPSPQAGGPPHTSGRFAAPPQGTGAHPAPPGTGAHPVPPQTGQHPAPPVTGAHLVPQPDADVTAQYPAITGDYPPPGTSTSQRLPLPNQAQQTSQALPVPPPAAAGEPVTEQFPRITDDAAATQVGATPPLTSQAPAGLDGDHDWFGSTGQQPYAALRGGRPAENDYPTSQGAAVVDDEDEDERDEELDDERAVDEDADDAERAESDSEADADEDYDYEDEDEPSPVKEWLVMLAQLGGGLVGGAGLWLGFQYLWSWMAPVALFLALAVIGGMVWLVRKIRKADDLQTIVLTVLVGLVVTISPAALLLVNR
ncbi:hypothetical protein [Allokutzneria oryzae]|uniref:Transmembrane protein n=1 Tax=Allokutzneria oryzae TaxID=1378989 RepID=A0ABV5ZWB8_9PSEU